MQGTVNMYVTCTTFRVGLSRIRTTKWHTKFIKLQEHPESLEKGCAIKCNIFLLYLPGHEPIPPPSSVVPATGM